MTRRISGGISGGAAVAGLQTVTTRITAANDLDIVVDPTGTGRFLINSTSQLENQSPIRFTTSNNLNWVALRGPSTAASDITWTLPNADGNNTQVLTTNGSGELSFTSPTIGITSNNVDSTIHNVSLTTATTGTINNLIVSDTKLRFQPSTGVLFSTVITGNTTSSGTLTLRSTSNATKGRVIIDETTTSTSTSTGALTVSGGVGIGENLNVNGIISTNSGTNGIIGLKRITGTTTLANRDDSYLVISTSTFTITLPASPSNGRTLKIFDGGNFAENNITFARNGSTIGGLAENLVADVKTSFILVFNNGDWELVL